MSISTRSGKNGQLIIEVQGRFDFSVHNYFRIAYESPTVMPSSYLVDMKGTSFLDCTALGMLLLLRDYAGGDSSDICIANVNEDVRKILTISSFEKLFEIS